VICFASGLSSAIATGLARVVSDDLGRDGYWELLVLLLTCRVEYILLPVAWTSMLLTKIHKVGLVLFIAYWAST